MRFAALTLARSVEVRGARWSEIDVDARLWVIPAERMKARREHRVPLSDCALDVLASMRDFANGSGLVFPAQGGRLIESAVLARLLRGTGGTLHGLRSTFRSWAAEAGVDDNLAESVLAHCAN